MKNMLSSWFMPEKPQQLPEESETKPIDEKKRAWIPIFEVCLRSNNQPIYATYDIWAYNLFSTYRVKDRHLTYRYSNPEMKDKLDKFYEQQTVNEIWNKDYLFPLQLVHYKDLVQGNWQLTTLDYKNTVPMYQANGEHRWDQIGEIIRSKMSNKKCAYVEIFVGVHGTIDKIKVNEGIKLNVPALVWKIVHCKVPNRSGAAIAIIMENTPLISAEDGQKQSESRNIAQSLALKGSSELKEFVAESRTSSSFDNISHCEDICADYGWDDISELGRKAYRDVYCCPFDKIKEIFRIEYLKLDVSEVLDVSNEVKGQNERRST